MVDEQAAGALRDRRRGLDELAGKGAQDDVGAGASAQLPINYGAAPRVASIVVASQRERRPLAVDHDAARRVRIRNEQAQRILDLPSDGRKHARQRKRESEDYPHSAL